MYGQCTSEGLGSLDISWQGSRTSVSSS